MAITIEGQPQTHNPVYNKCVYYLSSTNVAKDAFKYVAVLKDGGDTIATVKVSPRPGDSYGVVEVERLISPLITRRIALTDYTSADAVEHYKSIEVEFGEEFKAEWSYTSVTSRASGAYSGNVQLGAAAVLGNEHGYIVGGQIEITIVHPLLTGVHTVVEVVDAYNVVLNLTYQVAPGTSGVTYYADGRTEEDLNLSDSTLIYYNGVFKFIDFPNYDPAEYFTNSTSKGFLTNVFNGFRVSPSFDMWLAIGDTVGGSTRKLVITNGADTAEMDITFATIVQFYVGLNTSGYTITAGSFPIIKDDTEQITIQYFIDGVESSEPLTLNIDRRCGPEDYQILFEDRLGSLIPWTFNLHSEETQEIERLEYRQEIGDINASDTYGYLTSDRGETTVGVQEVRRLLLRSQYMTYEEEQYFKELLTSPTVFVKIDDKYVSCVIKNSSATLNGQGRKALRRKEITIEFANQDKINI